MTSGRTAQADPFGREKDSPVNGTSTSVEPTMSDRPSEREAFLGSLCQDQRRMNCSKPPLHEQVFTLNADLPRDQSAGGAFQRLYRYRAVLSFRVA